MPLTEFSASDGHTLGADTEGAIAAPASTFDKVALNLIVASRTNPRQTFDQVKLQELATSIRSIGVMQPILLRPLPADRVADTSTKASRNAPRPVYEIVSGERRFRASELAELDSIPAMIRQLDDNQVLEAQLVENLQRDDLHPMEEAQGYERLCQATGINKDAIAGKIGKSRTYVYNRLKLLTLTQESVQAFREGKLDSSRAELLATIADPKLQLKALKEFTTVGYGDRRKSVRECSQWLEQNILLKIKDAPFDTKDATLVEGCTACQDCPKRTHSDRDLFAAFDGPDMCTDAPCFQGKAAAHIARVRVDAEAKGLELVSGKEAKKLKPYAYGDDIKGHTKLSAKVETKDGEVSVASIIKDTDIKPVLFMDPHDSKKLVKIVPTEAIEQALKDKGLIKETRSDQAKKVDAAAEREREKRELEEAHRWLTIETISERIRDGAITAFSVEMMRMIARTLLANSDDDSDFTSTLLKLWHLPGASTPSQGYSDHRDRYQSLFRHVDAVHAEALAPMVLQILLATECDQSRQLPDYSWTHATPIIDHLAEETGVNTTKIMSDLKADLAEKKRAAKEAAQAAEAAPPPGTNVEAAPQVPVARGKGKVAKSRGAPKLTPQEAQLGIADAMQSIEGPAEGGTDLPEHLGDDTVQQLLMLGITTKEALREMNRSELAHLLGESIDSAKELVASLDTSELPDPEAAA